MFGNNILASPREQDKLEWNLSKFKLISLLTMLKFYAPQFWALLRSISYMKSVFDAIKKLKGLDVQLSDEDIETFLKCCQLINGHCEKIGLAMSAKQVDRIISELKSKSLGNIIAKQVWELEERLIDELSIPAFMVIQSDKVGFYENPSPFGGEVFDKFPSANFDIEEASKCFATARYTACVMHLQRVLEIGLKSYGECLGIMSLLNTPQPSWNLVLDKTRKEIKDRNDSQKPNKWSSQAEKEFCEEDIQPFLESVKIAWRNPSMHADKTYTEEVAKEILDAVKTFMRHLAKQMNEKGKFRKGKKK